MNGNDIIALGLGIQDPWEITDQLLDTDKVPHELRLSLRARRGSQYPCPVCGALCQAHDFKEMTWRHLNFFQHHCYVTAAVPRVRCPEHGVKRIKVPWARPGSSFTLLFEQASLLFVREMPVLTAARLLEVPDKKLWRLIRYYVAASMSKLDLRSLKAFAVDETSSRKGHRYVTVFLDLDRPVRPVIFAIPGKGKETLKAFKRHLLAHGGQAKNVLEVVSDMSRAFIAGIKEHFTNSTLTVDWFHVVQLMTKAVDAVRRVESKHVALPNATRWALLKKAEGTFTEKQVDALAELISLDLQTAKAWRVKEMLRWVRRAESPQAAKWRLTWFLHIARTMALESPLLKPVLKALASIEKYRDAIQARWHSGHNNARIEAFNGLFQATKRRARGYRNEETFISMIYLLAAPIQMILKST